MTMIGLARFVIIAIALILMLFVAIKWLLPRLTISYLSLYQHEGGINGVLQRRFLGFVTLEKILLTNVLSVKMDSAIHQKKSVYLISNETKLELNEFVQLHHAHDIAQFNKQLEHIKQSKDVFRINNLHAIKLLQILLSIALMLAIAVISVLILRLDYFASDHVSDNSMDTNHAAYGDEQAWSANTPSNESTAELAEPIIIEGDNLPVPVEFPDDISAMEFCRYHTIKYMIDSQEIQAFGKTSIDPQTAQNMIVATVKNSTWQPVDRIADAQGVALFLDRDDGAALEYVVTVKGTCIMTMKHMTFVSIPAQNL